MNIFSLLDNIQTLFATRNPEGYVQPIIAKGPPGMAKSSFFNGPFRDALSKLLNLPVDCIDQIMSTMEATDVRGLPIPDKSDPAMPKYRYAIPAIIARVYESPAYQAGGWVILNLDEFTQCDSSLQKVMSDLVLNYRIGDYRLPDRCWIVATGNRLSDSSGVQRQLSMLTNRMPQYDVELPLEYWLRYARGIALPPLCAAFAERFPTHFASEVPPRDGPFCTYRSFTVLSQYLKAFNKVNNKDLMHVEDSVFTRATAHGLIGEAAALEFFAFCRVADQLPSRKDVLTKPESAYVPDSWQIDAQYAAASMAVAIAMEDPLNVAPAVKYLMRLPTIELTVKAMVDLNSHSGGAITMNNPEAARWLMQHKALVTDAVI